MGEGCRLAIPGDDLYDFAWCKLHMLYYSCNAPCTSHVHYVCTTCPETGTFFPRTRHDCAVHQIVSPDSTTRIAASTTCRIHQEIKGACRAPAHGRTVRALRRSPTELERSTSVVGLMCLGLLVVMDPRSMVPLSSAGGSCARAADSSWERNSGSSSQTPGAFLASRNS